MKISTKGRYGLRSMVDLAINSISGHVSLNSIAERQNISLNYLEQVFAILRKAGLVKSVKGAQGGYTLGDSTESITVGRILSVLEGKLSVYNNGSKNDNSSNIEAFLANNVWEKIDQSINSVVDSITLEELVFSYKNSESESQMYYI